MPVFLLGALLIVLAFCLVLAVLLLQVEASITRQQLLPTHWPNIDDPKHVEHDAA
jgi:hypothetical protein